MNPSHNLAPGPVIRCLAAACAAVWVPHDEVRALRQRPHPTPAEFLPTNLLKHADDQTVVGLAAVLQALADAGLDRGAFGDWGVVAAPRFLGRSGLAGALHKFAQEGAWGISPHLIPHRSLHSVSGTISQALRIHGPNLGVGGGRGAAAEGLLTAAALLARDQLPGVWLVLTGYDPELVPADPGAADAPGNATATRCGAVALALVTDHDAPLLELEVDVVAAGAGRPACTLEALAALVESGGPGRGDWALPGGGRVWVQRSAVGQENCL